MAWKRGPDCFTARFIQSERRLRRELKFPTDLVIIMRNGMQADERRFGCTFIGLDTKARREKLVIHIDSGMSEQEAVDTLIHETAHALAWGKEREAHDLEWGKALSRCYRVAVEGRSWKRKAKRR